MFSSSKLEVKSLVPLMSSILRSPCSVVSIPFLVLPSRCAIHIEFFPEVMHDLMYLDSNCEER